MPYQPAHGRFAAADPAAELARLSAVVPGTIVTLGAERLVASILPMVLDRDAGVLRGHLARANPQWRDISPRFEALALFDGPEAYVTPTWYPTKRRTGREVPTWNYITVEVRGRLRVIHDPSWLLAHLRGLVDRHEAGRSEPWSIDDPPDGYIAATARAIVGLELDITSIEAKRKLSQNRPAEDFNAVLSALERGDARERAVADEMRKESPRDRDGA